MIKKIFIPLAVVLLPWFNSALLAQSLHGIIRDAETKEVIPGASIYVPDLRTGAISDLNGKYELTNLPKGKFIIQVKMLGYSTISISLDLNSVTEKDFSLNLTSIEKKEVVVTGSAFTTDSKRTSVVVTPIDKLKILTSGSGNLVQAIATSPGISMVSTGNSIAKPLIRGLGFNRVVVVNEGIRQEGQQWGDEHGLEIDQFSADRIEVLKGPSSLLYGSDALGGVINVLEPIPPSPGKIGAEISSQYHSNSSLVANSLMCEGNQNGFTWRGRASYKTAAPYSTPTEKIYNSAYEEKYGELLLGIHKSWGYSHLHFSRWFDEIGITEGERDSLTGKLLDSSGNIASESELRSRTSDLPYQHVEHSKISSVNNLILGKSQLRINLGLQQNNRQEFTSQNQNPDLSLRLNTFTYDVKYYFPEKNDLETAIGVSGMSQKNQNLGTEYLIPDFTVNDAGIFASVKKSYQLTTLNLGLRYDHRQTIGKGMQDDSLLIFSPFDLNFSSVSFSAGITHKMSEALSLKANFGRGFRAPSIPELSSNGIHEGTNQYEKGNQNLHPETSLQADLGILYERPVLEISLNVFLNNIDNYIYSRNLDNQSVVINNHSYPIFYYVQGQSTLYGGELTLDIHPVKRLHFENSLSYVRGQNQALDTPLPYIPPLKIVNELKYEFKTGKESRFKDPYLKIEAITMASQNNTDVYETRTKGYSILNAGIGSDIRLGKQIAVLYILASNLFNTSYFDHLSRLKTVGIHAEGRNLAIGIMVPIGLR